MALRGPNIELMLGYGTSQDGRVREEQPTTWLEDPEPVGQRCKPVLEMKHRINADRHIECVLFEVKSIAAIGDDELDVVAQSHCERSMPGFRDGLGFDVHAGKLTARGGNHCQRGTS